MMRNTIVSFWHRNMSLFSVLMIIVTFLVTLIVGTLTAAIIYAHIQANSAEHKAEASIQQSEHAWCTIFKLSLQGLDPSKLHGKTKTDYYAVKQISDNFGCVF